MGEKILNYNLPFGDAEKQVLRTIIDLVAADVGEDATLSMVILAFDPSNGASLTAGVMVDGPQPVTIKNLM